MVADPQAIAPLSIADAVSITDLPLQEGSWQSWGDAPDTGVFYGRAEELARLESWIVEERCRLVALLGAVSARRPWRRNWDAVWAETSSG